MKIFQGLGTFTLSALVITGLIVTPSASGNPGAIKITIESIDAPNVQVMGGRGAALARLSDGRLPCAPNLRRVVRCRGCKV